MEQGRGGGPLSAQLPSQPSGLIYHSVVWYSDSQLEGVSERVAEHMPKLNLQKEAPELSKVSMAYFIEYSLAAAFHSLHFYIGT